MTLPLDVLHVFSTFAIGGPQVRFAALVNHFGDAAKHRIVAMDGNRAARELVGRHVDMHFPKVGIRKSDTTGNWARIRGYLGTKPPDVLVTSNWGSIDWAIARPGRLRHVHMEDGFGPEERDRQLTRRVWTRRLVLRDSEILLPSRTVETIARKVWLLPKKRLHYVPNGVNAARFAGVAPAVLPAGQGPVIGTVTALRGEKNLGRLLEAFAIVRAARPCRLVIVGDGPERAALQNQAATLGVAVDVHFAGHSGAPEHFLAAFDIFALSSDTEQMPLSVLEAGASGLPVAATDVGDVRGMVAEANAPFVVKREAPALAASLAGLMADPARAAAIGAANRARVVQDFSEASMFAAHWALWTGAKTEAA